MPGSGKSTVGVLLAKALGYSFIDTDLIISRRAKKPLQNILNEDGIEAFLRLEEEDEDWAMRQIDGVRFKLESLQKGVDDIRFGLADISDKPVLFL